MRSTSNSQPACHDVKTPARKRIPGLTHISEVFADMGDLREYITHLGDLVDPAQNPCEWSDNQIRAALRRQGIPRRSSDPRSAQWAYVHAKQFLTGFFRGNHVPEPEQYDRFIRIAVDWAGV